MCLVVFMSALQASFTEKKSLCEQNSNFDKRHFGAPDAFESDYSALKCCLGRQLNKCWSAAIPQIPFPLAFPPPPAGCRSSGTTAVVCVPFYNISFETTWLLRLAIITVTEAEQQKDRKQTATEWPRYYYLIHVIAIFRFVVLDINVFLKPFFSPFNTWC